MILYLCNWICLLLSYHNGIASELISKQANARQQTFSKLCNLLIRFIYIVRNDSFHFRLSRKQLPLLFHPGCFPACFATKFLFKLQTIWNLIGISTHRYQRMLCECSASAVFFRICVVFLTLNKYPLEFSPHLIVHQKITSVDCVMKVFFLLLSTNYHTHTHEEHHVRTCFAREMKFILNAKRSFDVNLSKLFGVDIIVIHFKKRGKKTHTALLFD